VARLKRQHGGWIASSGSRPVCLIPPSPSSDGTRKRNVKAIIPDQTLVPQQGLTDQGNVLFRNSLALLLAGKSIVRERRATSSQCAADLVPFSSHSKANQAREKVHHRIQRSIPFQTSRRSSNLACWKPRNTKKENGS